MPRSNNCCVACNGRGSVPVDWSNSIHANAWILCHYCQGNGLVLVQEQAAIRAAIERLHIEIAELTAMLELRRSTWHVPISAGGYKSVTLQECEDGESQIIEDDNYLVFGSYDKTAGILRDSGCEELTSIKVAS